MQITDYKFITGTEHREGYIAIPELDRKKSVASEFIKLANLDITITRPTAFLYVDGFSISSAEESVTVGKPAHYQIALKMGSSYIAHEWVSTFKNNHLITYVDIICSTCAAGIQAIKEAQSLLNSGYEEVIIIGAERTTHDTLRLFRELQIPITCGEGFVYMKLDNKKDRIKDIQWKFRYLQNPFYFDTETLDTLLPYEPVDFVKLHGTGTEANTEAEKHLEEFATPIRYKDRIGHTQGISALIETCMVLDDPNVTGKIMVTANGVGGFYGAFTIIK